VHITNLKAIVFLVGFIFLMATLTGPVSAINCNFDPGSDFQTVTAVNPINYSIIETNNDYAYYFENLVKNDRSPTNKRSKDPTDFHFKKQKQGIENLKIISTGGIPPKGPGEIIMHNLPKMLSMIKSVKTKITNNISTFYKKNLK